MNTQVTEIHTQKQIKSAINAIIFYALAISIIIAYHLISRKTDTLIINSIIVIAFSSSIYNLFKEIRLGRNAYPTINIDTELLTISATYNNTTATHPISDIKNIKFQYKSNQLYSILIDTNSGQKINIIGYERMEEISEILKKHAPQHKTEKLGWFNR